MRMVKPMRNLWLIDFKTSNGIYLPDYALQLAAYRETYKPLTNEEIHVGILRLDKLTGLPEFADLTTEIERYWLGFKSLRDAYEHLYRTKEIKKGYNISGIMEPSVTTVIGILDKPPIVQWAANETVNYFRSNLQTLREGTDEQVEYVFKKGKTAYRSISKDAMDTGTVVHNAIEAHLSGMKPEDIIGDNEAAQNAFLAFLEWEKSVGLEVLHTETVLLNYEYRFGGTVDLISYAEIGG